MNTSYFARLKHIPKPLSISGKAPSFYTGPEFKVLAPKYDFFSAYKAGEIDSLEYTKLFKSKVLAPLNPHEIYQDLIEEHGQDVTLLCYEKPGDFCHRRLVAEWFEQNLDGIKVDELKF